MISTASVPVLDTDALTNRVRRAVGLPVFRIGHWQCVALSHPISNPATGGLYRVSGSGYGARGPAAWSLILKVVRLAEHAPQGWGTDLLHFGYWKREALAYQSGLLSSLGSNLKAPECYDVIPQPDGSLWIWLEEVQEAGELEWSLSRYGLAARHFGQWQGTYFAGRPLPSLPWLQTGWLRSWVTHFEFLENFLLRREFWEHPIVREAFPVPVTERIQRLWTERDHWLRILDRQPLTLCHFDTWRPNLLACSAPGGQDQTVALDWQCVGLGPAGEVSNLVITSLMNLEVPASDAPALDAAVWEGYLSGLREAGWKGDPRAVRFFYNAYPVLRWGLVFPMLMILPAVLDENKRVEAEAKYRRPITELVCRWAEAFYFLLDRADEAHRLASAV